jgi:nucleotide-binding universal stress UspA family protein
MAAKIDLPREKVSTAARFGGVFTELLDEAEQWRADLIVVGAHKRSMASFLLGSTAAALSRHAKCTVMIVRSPLVATLL